MNDHSLLESSTDFERSPNYLANLSDMGAGLFKPAT